MLRILTSLLVLLLAGCGGKDAPSPSPAGVSIPNPLPLPMCHVPGTDKDITVFTDAYAGCHTPNMGMEHGKLCFSGEAWACDVLPLALTDTSLVKDPINVGANHGGSGSRDELMGHLLYIVKTHDKAHASKLLRMIKRNSGRVCTDDADGRCTVTPAMWGLMRIVWNHIGLSPSWEMLAGNIGDDLTRAISAETAPVGYQLNLIALNLLIRRHTDTWDSLCSSTLKSLRERFPNLFVRYLNGEDVSKELTEAIEAQKANPPQMYVHWSWSRLTPSLEDHPGAYLFLKNLIERK